MIFRVTLYTIGALAACYCAACLGLAAGIVYTDHDAVLLWVRYYLMYGGK